MDLNIINLQPLKLALSPGLSHVFNVAHRKGEGLVRKAVFSLTYLILRHVGPTSLQYRVSFDVHGNSDDPCALMWPQATPKLCPPVMP